jgi:hypothetical protein
VNAVIFLAFCTVLQEFISFQPAMEGHHLGKFRLFSFAVLVAVLVVMSTSLAQSNPTGILNFQAIGDGDLRWIHENCEEIDIVGQPTEVSRASSTMIVRFGGSCEVIDEDGVGAFCPTLFVRTETEGVCSSVFFTRGAGEVLGDHDPLLQDQYLLGPDSNAFLFSHPAGGLLLISSPVGFESEILE